MMDARLLTWVMTDPTRAAQLDARGWTDLLTMANAERISGSLAHRLEGQAVPASAARVLDRARKATEAERRQALWEAEMCRQALAGLNVPVILLKGTALVAAGLAAGQGRQIGDLDILVPRDRIDEVEAALIKAGWEWVKPDPYDDAYYRTHMHELPPMIHSERDRMIDVHHTILPLTTRQRPDAASLIANARQLENGQYVLAPEDMVIHSVAHLFADGDLAGGIRNLWDIDQMLREFAAEEGFWLRLRESGLRHGLMTHVSRALRLSHHLYETPVDPWLAFKARRGDVFYMGRLLARNGWGQETRKLLRLAFYIRSHWIRMPPLMLARHLFTKWRKAKENS
jgi:Uncharacterised nucleotidyltransferase